MATEGFINTPPANERDLMIAKGMLLNAGITADVRDPSKGVKLSPARWEGYEFETKGPGIIAGLSVCIAIITIVTGARLYFRAFTPRLKWGLDDTLMVPGLLMAIAYPALQIAMVQYGGAGKHIFDVSYSEYYIYKWLANIAQIDFFVCVGIIKMSITAFNIRLTNMSSLYWKIINWCFFALCAIYTLAAFFINIFQCSPPGGSFDLFILARQSTPPTCIGVSNMNTILRVINITLDYLLLAVPIIVLWRVQMSWTKKFRLFAIFSIGALACIGSVMTLISKFRLKTDALWNYTSLLGWSLVELTLGVLAASLPTLAFLLPSSMRSSKPRYQTGYQYHGGSAEVRTDHSRSQGKNPFGIGPGGGGYVPNTKTGRRNVTHFVDDSGSEGAIDLERDTAGIMRTDEIELRMSGSEVDVHSQWGKGESLYDVTGPGRYGSAVGGGGGGWRGDVRTQARGDSAFSPVETLRP